MKTLKNIFFSLFAQISIACFIIIISSNFAFSIDNKNTTKNEKDIILPTYKELNITLTKALLQRKSTRDFNDIAQPIGLENLSTILWAAIGINREDGKRTAPMVMDKDYIKLYIFSNSGIYLYDVKNNILKNISSDNVKEKIVNSSKSAVAEYIILITADISELPFFFKREQKINLANANAGCIAQNIYLSANALNLDTCLMAYFKDKKVSEILKLKKDELPLFIMPLGVGK